MTLIALTRAVLLGFLVAAPIGPLAMVLISRTLRSGPVVGVASGLGCAVADAACAAVAAFGVSLIIGFVSSHSFWLQLFGGFLLLIMGARIALQPPPDCEGERVSPGAGHLWGAFVSCLFLTLANPMTLLAFSAILAGMAAATIDVGTPEVLVGGVFVGSMTWWLFLVGITRVLHRRLSPNLLAWLSRGAGGALAVFGIGLLVAL